MTSMEDIRSHIDMFLRHLLDDVYVVPLLTRTNIDDVLRRVLHTINITNLLDHAEWCSLPPRVCNLLTLKVPVSLGQAVCFHLSEVA